VSLHDVGWSLSLALAEEFSSIEEDFAPIDAKALANLLLAWSNERGIEVSNMKLQKLMYFCHADFLVKTRRLLIRQEFEAWEFGPVIPCLYQEFKEFGRKPITGRATRFDPIKCVTEVAEPCNLGTYEHIVEESFSLYSRHSAATLSNLSHVENGPWAASLARFERGSHRGKLIENELIAKHHFHPFEKSVH